MFRAELQIPLSRVNKKDKENKVLRNVRNEETTKKANPERMTLLFHSCGAG